jgi:CRISPR-associated endonuclease Csn1
MLVLGLDIGITSCGWALVDEEDQKIVASGVRIFDRAENAKDGKSLAAPRREARLTRRRLRRRRNRLNQLAILLARAGIVSCDTNVHHPTVSTKLDVWQLRVDALDRSLTGEELHRVLHHIGKRRGFRSSKKVRAQRDDGLDTPKSEPTEEGKALQGSRELEKAFRESGYRTIGEYLALLPRQATPENQVDSARFRKIRNDHSLYQRTVLRCLLEAEVAKIFEAQRKLGNPALNDTLEKKISSILFDQKRMQSVEHLVGDCTFLKKEEKRAPRASWSGERFVFLQKITNLRWWDSETGEERRPDQDQIGALLEHAVTKKKVTYAHVADILRLPREYEFSGVRYQIQKGTRAKAGQIETNPSDADINKDELRAKENQKQTFFGFTFYHQVKSELADCLDDWTTITSVHELFDEIGWVLSVYKDDGEKAEKLAELGLTPKAVEKLAELSFDSFLSVSFTAMRKMLPFLESGLIYSEAAKNAVYSHYQPTEGKENSYLPKFADLPNPVVNRALSQTRKVVNAIIRTYGKPDNIVVELAREMGKSFDERRRIENENKERNVEKQARKEEWLAEFKSEPKGKDILKARLYRQQRGLCAYSGECIPMQLLIDETAVEVDHIIPFSRSFDDSMSNKVLVLTKANREKGSQTPYEWFGNDTNRWNRFCSQHQNAPLPKRNRLFGKVSKDDEWKERSLNDTRYIAREFLSHVRANLLPDTAETGRRARATSGGITQLLRHFWGVGQKNRSNHRHHCEDAILAALVTPRMTSILTRYFQKKERAGIFGEGQIREKLPLPWDGFRNDVQRAVDQVFVSRMPRRKVTGLAHQATVRSSREKQVSREDDKLESSKVIYERKKLEDLKIADLDRLIDPKRNWKLKEGLKERLEKEEFKGDGKRAFKEPFFIEGKHDGTLGALVKSVLLETGEKSGVEVNGQGKKGKGIASNGSMVRVDIFQRVVRGKSAFYAVPVYAWQFSQKNLPNRAIAANKSEDQWPEVTSDFQFMFSLYPNDYVEVDDGKGRIVEGYYAGIHRGTAAIGIVPHDVPNESAQNVGSKTVKSIRKFEIDILGNRREVLPGKEPRRGLENRRSRKQRLRPV